MKDSSLSNIREIHKYLRISYDSAGEQGWIDINKEVNVLLSTKTMWKHKNVDFK